MSLRFKTCPICQQPVQPLQPAYKEVGCGQEGCPGKLLYDKYMQEAANQFVREMAKRDPINWIDTSNIHSWKDAKNKL